METLGLRHNIGDLVSPLPLDPHDSLVTFEPSAVRRLSVFGAPVEAVLVPGRKSRGDRARRGRPAFAPNPAQRILDEETFWRGDGLALTPNLYPFSQQQRLLWPETPRREPDAAMWSAICTWTDGTGGTAMVNTIGAAATIARAHAHLTPERLEFLANLPERDGPTGLVDLPPGVELVQKDIACCLLGVRGGDAAARGQAIWTLAGIRLTAACNVCIQDGTAWLFPRRVETPAPHFPFALGGAELWGRWCYIEEEPFAAAAGQDLERAFVEAGMPSMPR